MFFHFAHGQRSITTTACQWRASSELYYVNSKSHLWSIPAALIPFLHPVYSRQSIAILAFQFRASSDLYYLKSVSLSKIYDSLTQLLGFLSSDSCWPRRCGRRAVQEKPLNSALAEIDLNFLQKPVNRIFFKPNNLYHPASLKLRCGMHRWEESRIAGIVRE